MNEAVKLRIKSPSASIPDLYLELAAENTVHDVKRMISEQYPEHPSPEDQKLVYSGRLLQDQSKLSKVLRFEDECSHFTVHLVCRMREAQSSTVSGITASPNTPHTDSSISANGQQQNGLRHRRNVPGGLVQDNGNPVEEQSQQAQQLTAQLQASQVQAGASQLADARQLETIHTMLQDLMSSTPDLSADQLAVYQQLYMQYISLSTQYLNSAATSGVGSGAQVQAAVPDRQNPLADGQAGNDAAPLANVDNGGGVGGAAAVVGGDEAGGGAIDPLEHAYSVLRVAILFCIMYTHSSFYRLLFVVLGLLAVYYFRNRNADQEEADRPLAAADQRRRRREQPEAGDGQDDNNRQQPDSAVSARDSGDESAPEETQQEEEEEPKPNFFTVAFTFVSTLVSSILPDNANLIQ